MGVMNTIWTKSQQDKLRILWRNGHTTSRIAKMMGVTKNSICGKARRMGLPMRNPPRTV